MTPESPQPRQFCQLHPAPSSKQESCRRGYFWDAAEPWWLQQQRCYKSVQTQGEPCPMLPSALWSHLSARAHDCVAIPCDCDLLLDKKPDCYFSIPHFPHWAVVPDLLLRLSHLPGVIHPRDLSRVSAFQDVCPPLHTGESSPFCPAGCMACHLYLFKPSFAQRVLFYQVIYQTESTIWMSVPSSSSFTTPPALSPLKLCQLWLCASQSPLKGHSCPHLLRLCVWHFHSEVSLYSMSWT